MKTYYGPDENGKMRHLDLRESMEQWHLRCRETTEAYRRLRADFGTRYSHAAANRDLRDLRARVEALEAAQRVLAGVMSAAVSRIDALELRPAPVEAADLLEEADAYAWSPEDPGMDFLW